MNYRLTSSRYGLGNKVESFKHRLTDLSKPVRVHRNLHNRKVKSFSIIQHGRVVAHATQLMLLDCTFHVSEAGRQRVLRQKHKNVHAHIRGTIALKGGMGATAVATNFPCKISYNPYTDRTFVGEVSGCKKFPVESAFCAVLNQSGVGAAYVD